MQKCRPILSKLKWGGHKQSSLATTLMLFLYLSLLFFSILANLIILSPTVPVGYCVVTDDLPLNQQLAQNGRVKQANIEYFCCLLSSFFVKILQKCRPSQNNQPALVSSNQLNLSSKFFNLKRCNNYGIHVSAVRRKIYFIIS